VQMMSPPAAENEAAPSTSGCRAAGNPASCITAAAKRLTSDARRDASRVMQASIGVRAAPSAEATTHAPACTHVPRASLDRPLIEPGEVLLHTLLAPPQLELHFVAT